MFYTYIWRDSAGVPFYVGKGSGKRAYNAGDRSIDFKVIYGQGGCAVEIVDEFILESQAHAHETDLIELYGRREFGGLLVNKTDGGEGISGVVRSDETRAKISAALRGKGVSLETRTKMRIANLGRKHTQETIDRCAAASLGRVHHDEARAKMSAATVGKKKSLEHRAVLGAVKRMAPPKVGFKGVSYCKDRGNWQVGIRIDGKSSRVGRFQVPEEAASAYDRAAYAAWGDACYLNFPDEIIKEQAIAV